MNARRRVARQSLQDVEIHDINAHHRLKRQNITHGERTALLARHNALYAARRDTPCAESIAMECPDGCNPSLDQTAQSYPMDNDTLEAIVDGTMDDEYYMFAGQANDDDYEMETTEVDEMEKAEDKNKPAPTSSIPDPFDYVYSNIPKSTPVLKIEPDCSHCGAKKFQYEPKGFCCRDGKIKLVENDTPPELMRLWTSADPDAKHFRDHIRYFNGHFSFTTLGVSFDETIANMSSGVYTFLAHGQIYHNIHSFGPRESGPEHLELYFYDDDPTLDHRFRRSPSLDQDVIRSVANILRNNPYSETFQSLGQADDLANYRVTLNLDHRLDQRRGESGWHQGLPKNKITKQDASKQHDDDPDCNSRIHVSVRDYYCYKFQMRCGIFNLILHGGRLFQQFAVDMYIKVESSRLDYVRNHQKEIRADLYQGLMDSIQAGESRASAIGKRTVLPALFVGGGRDMKRRYMDAMALVQKYGKPDVFLTMTFRVFRAKLEDLKKQLFEKHMLGKVIAHVYVVEFQKRGLPHAHFLLIMSGRYKLTSAQQYDRIISTELPDNSKYKELYDMVTNHMMHGPCGPLNRRCQCMQDGKSKNHYPRDFNPSTSQGKDSYPLYRRRNDHRSKVVRGHPLDNRGHDRASVSINEAGSNGEIDEIQHYRDASQDLRDVLDKEDAGKSMLTAYFDANRQYEWARDILYRDFPMWFTWQPGGSTSFEDLRTIDGVVMPSFRAAAERRGLIEADNTLDECLTEAEVFQMPSSLHRLFATILVFCEPSDVLVLWDKHVDAMCDDYKRNTSSQYTVEQMLNLEQMATYNEIMSAINSAQGGVFFIDGPGGTGKTFLYRALLATVRGHGNLAVATATSGVAASIMPGGRTAHSRFKIPIGIDDGAYCSFTKQSGTAKLLQRASLIIWDEASMTKRQAVEGLDRSMRDIMGCQRLPFGGKTVVFGGDFRQVLPVFRKGTRSQITDATLRRSYLWDCMVQLKLVRNMRAQNDAWFAEYLLRVGNGTEEVNKEGHICLPLDICVPYKGDLDGLIDTVFPNLNDNLTDPNYITSRAILSTRNETSWLNGAFSKVAKTVHVAGSRTREKFQIAVSNLTAKLSKTHSHHPFRKLPGLPIAAVFHPSQKMFFVATKKIVQVYDLQKAQLVKKLESAVRENSSISIHPGGKLYVSCMLIKLIATYLVPELLHIALA
ncbi:uncharacterized protein LOC127761779 [Oryza glaberrima]|uniref:uncharacterized protein LOC127761779 n=1 Tax=Oryza glaberrima TaxID=4538 RepID=UPI00224BF75E|nr:uncharacterized protein LOC127761779 [Oryza glaberrima]